MINYETYLYIFAAKFGLSAHIQGVPKVRSSTLYICNAI